MNSSGTLAPTSSPCSELTASPTKPASPPLQGPEPASDLSDEHFRDPAEGTFPLGHDSSVPAVNLPKIRPVSMCVHWRLWVIMLQAALFPDFK